MQWIIILILAVLVLWVVHRKELVSLDELCGNALSQMGFSKIAVGMH